VAKFLNKKEQVIDFKLTNYGHYLLSVGELKPTYYAFYDDNVLYDGEHAGITGSQNSTRERIKDETQYLEGLTIFNNLDYSLQKYTEGGSNGDFYEANVEATLNTPNAENYRFNSMIGDAHLDGDTQNAPAWKIVTLEGEISSSTNIDEVNQIRIPQINIGVNYSLEVKPAEIELDFEGPASSGDRMTGFPDNEMIQLVMRDPLIYGEEVNTQLFSENFEIEVFEVVDTVTPNTFNRKRFIKEEDDVVDGLLVPRKNKIRPILTTDMTDYYFNVFVDHEIDEATACRGAEVFNKDSYYVDLDFDCDQVTTDTPVNVDIYGRVTEPEICLD
tara:strand:- start:8821 stop:9810 length:990 start_codon:yes stop_codon:yes gene_type:complete